MPADIRKLAQEAVELAGKATQGEWRSRADHGDGDGDGHDHGHILSGDDPIALVEYGENDDGDERFIIDAANARPALKAHLVAVARLVEAARDAFAYLYPGGSSPHSLSESCGCPRCDAGRYLKIALQEVDREG
jgi:hypothetical protein